MRVKAWELEASICRDSLYDFVQRFWSVAIPEKPVWNWHIKVICDILQEAAERIFRGEPKEYDLVINIPPGTTKSTIVSVMFPTWLWTRMPTARSICASYTHLLALDLSRKSRDIVQSDKWIHLFGDIELREDQNAKGYFLNNQGGFRYASGTDGTVTGFHGHVIIVDDPLDPNRAVSAVEIKKSNRWVTETLETRKVDKAVTLTVLIMQRLHQDDPSASLLKKSTPQNPVKHINLPGEVEGSGIDVVRPRRLAHFYKAGLLDPVRLPRKVLEDMKGRLGQYGYSSQVLQCPVPPGGGMFKVERIKIDQPPLERHMVDIVRYWDKAGTEGGGCQTVGVKMGIDRQARFWILDVIRGQWDSAVREDIIEQTAKADGIHVRIAHEQEPGSGGKESAENTTRRLAGFRVVTNRPVGDKTFRADPFSVQVNARNVYLKAGPWNTVYLEELRYFPFSSFKDQVDGSSGAFTILTKQKTMVGSWGRTPVKR